MALSAAAQQQAHQAGKKAYKANAKNAAEAKVNEDRLINQRQGQEQEATASKKLADQLKTQQLVSTAQVAAGESGGTLNNNAVIQNIMRQGLESNTMAGQNLGRTTAQLGEERLGAGTRAQSRINSVTRPSGAAASLGIASTLAQGGASAYGSYQDSLAPPTATTPPPVA